MRNILLTLSIVLSSLSYGQAVRPVKYVQQMSAYIPEVQRENGLVTYFDLDEALVAAKKLKKPILLYFTGINCVNCRKMENNMWPKAEVMKRLKENFVVVTLYGDFDRVELPKAEQHYSKALKKKIITVADKCQELQEVKYKSNTMPSYYVINEYGKILNGWFGYETDVKKFVAYMDIGVEKYKKQRP